MKMRTLLIYVICLGLLSCSEKDNQNSNSQSEWLVDEQDIVGEFSLFPLAVDPPLESVSQMSLPANQLVGVVILGSNIRVYPYLHALQSEIINDEINGQKIAFSYCPITKSALAFRRQQNFRASGYLYNDNLTPWDEQTESIWSQMLIKGIRGTNSNVRLNTIPVVETKWSTVQQYFPNALAVQNFNASRQAAPPDGNTGSGTAPNNGDLVYGIIDNFNGVSIFKFTDFANTHFNNLTVQSQNYIVYGDASKHIINAFKVPNFETYQTLENQFPNVLKNSNGVTFDVFGRGSNGTQLEKPKYAYVAIWSAWADFYSDFTFLN